MAYVDPVTKFFEVGLIIFLFIYLFIYFLLSISKI